MKPYGMERHEYYDDDCDGVIRHGRTSKHGVKQSSHGKQRARRFLKRRARLLNKQECVE